VIVDILLAVSPVGNEGTVGGDVDGQSDLAVEVRSEDDGQPVERQQFVVDELGQREQEFGVEGHFADKSEAEDLFANERHLHLVVKLGNHALHPCDQHSGHGGELGRRVLHPWGQNFVLDGQTQGLRLFKGAGTKVEPESFQQK